VAVALSKIVFRYAGGISEMSSKALGALAVAQRDISRAQFCAREIGPR